MDKLLEKLPYWDKLSGSERALVKGCASLQHHKAGKILHGNCDGGGSCLGMFLVLSGAIRVYLISDEGREVTLFRLSAGDSCVMFSSCVLSQISFDTQMSVVEDAEVLVVPCREFAELTNSSTAVRLYMYELSIERFSTALWVMQQILFARFDQRLASFFLEEYGKTGSRELRMTQEQIAREVNSAREVVSRMLKQFASDGLIENRRGVILLKDLDGLEKIT